MKLQDKIELILNKYNYKKHHLLLENFLYYYFFQDNIVQLVSIDYKKCYVRMFIFRDNDMDMLVDNHFADAADLLTKIIPYL